MKSIITRCFRGSFWRTQLESTVHCIYQLIVLPLGLATALNVFIKLLVPLAANLGIMTMFTYIDGSAMSRIQPISLSEPGMPVYRNFKRDTLQKKLPEVGSSLLLARCFVTGPGSSFMVCNSYTRPNDERFCHRLLRGSRWPLMTIQVFKPERVVVVILVLTDNVCLSYLNRGLGNIYTLAYKLWYNTSHTHSKPFAGSLPCPTACGASGVGRSRVVAACADQGIMQWLTVWSLRSM